MLQYLIEKFLGKRTKCWTCKYFIEKINNIEVKDKHYGLCQKYKNYYEPRKYCSSICINYKKGNKNG